MLRKTGILLVLLFVIPVVAAAQSGRRITSAPTPIATPVVENADSYSESSPNRAVSIYARPSSRRDKKKKSDRNTQTAETDSAGETGLDPDEEVIKIESNLVTIPVSVSDRNGVYVTGLDPHNFKIFEDGEEREVAYFGVTDQPFTVVLVLDMSSSTTYKIEEIQAAAISFVNELKPEDSVMVISFDSSVRILTEVTQDRQKIMKAINRTNFGGGTSLYEAVAKSLGRRLDRIEGRKAIILFTDGVDTTSLGASFESTLRDAEEADARIFPIYYNTFLNIRGIGGNGPMTSIPSIGMPGMGGQSPPGTRPEDYQRGRMYLNELAEITGGRVFRPDAAPGQLDAAFRGIADELRRQYNIGFYPPETGEMGERRTIRVRVNRPGLIVRARDSYIVGDNQTDSGSN